MAEHVTENNCGAVKLAGYLEKKKKKALVSSWKRYWFVLEGRLLLYYKNSEGSNLCPCKGSINMGLATDVRPLICSLQTFTTHYMFEIISHTYNTIWLRTKDRASYEQWLQALLDALGQPNVSTPVNLTRFRYSMDSLIPPHHKQHTNNKFQLKRQNTLPSQQKNVELDRSHTFMKRVKQMGGYTSKSLDVICKESRDLNVKSSPKIPRSKNLSRMIEKSVLHESNTDIQKKDPSESSTSIKESSTTAEYECVQNSLYSTINKTSIETGKEEINNTDEYVVLREDSEQKSFVDENKNCCILRENNQHSHQPITTICEELNECSLKTDEINQPPDDCENDMEYYYSYGEIKGEEMNDKQSDDIYNQYTIVPELPVDEPVLPPRHEKTLDNISNIVDNISSSTEGSEKKLSRIQRIKNKFFHSKDKDDVYEKINKKPKGKKSDFFRKRKLSFLKKVVSPHKKKETKNCNDDEPEPDYDYVDYATIKDNLNKENIQDDTITYHDSKKVTGGFKILSVATMSELQSKLSNKKETNEQVNNKEVNDAETNDIEVPIDYEELEESNEIQIITVHAEVNSSESEINLLHSENMKNKPGLPEKKHNTRPRSPWHDVPSNNTPFLKPGLKREIIVSPHKYESVPPSLNNTNSNIDYNDNSSQDNLIEDTILNEDASQKPKENKNTNSNEDCGSDLSVKQLIEKYNNSITCVNEGKTSICKVQSRQRINEEGVTLRRGKCNSCLNYDQSRLSDKHIYKINRNSDELNRLLDELAKITNAPLLQPGVTNSLVQVRPRGLNVNTHSYGPLSDEEWLALTPIRRRRHSEPDYDIPRSHRSLVHTNRSSQNVQSEEIPKTRFFGPILPSEDSSIRDSIELSNTICFTSITPDSLEPLSIDHIQTKTNHIEKDRSISNEICQYSALIPIEERPAEDSCNTEEDDAENVINNPLVNDKFYDSLEQSTVF